MAKTVEIDFWNQLSITPAQAGALMGVGKKVIEILMDNDFLPYMKKGPDRIIWIEDLKELRIKLRYKQVDLNNLTVEDLERGKFMKKEIS